MQVTWHVTGTYWQTRFMQVTVRSSQTGQGTHTLTVFVRTGQGSQQSSQQSWWHIFRNRSQSVGPQGTSLHS